VRHRQTKGAATDMFDLQPPRHISTLRIFPVPAGFGEGPFTEPTTASQPWRRQPLLMAGMGHIVAIGEYNQLRYVTITPGGRWPPRRRALLGQQIQTLHVRRTDADGRLPIELLLTAVQHIEARWPQAPIFSGITSGSSWVLANMHLVTECWTDHEFVTLSYTLLRSI
jgi:hypothetical protein